MYFLFKDDKQITKGYNTPDEIPVQIEHYKVNGKPGQRLLWPRSSLDSYDQDGYEIKELK